MIGVIIFSLLAGIGFSLSLVQSVAVLTSSPGFSRGEDVKRLDIDVARRVFDNCIFVLKRNFNGKSTP